MVKDIRTAFSKSKEKSIQIVDKDRSDLQPQTSLVRLGTPVTSSSKRPNTELSPPSLAMEDSIVSKINSMIDSKMKLWGEQLESLKADVIESSTDKMTKMQKAFSEEIDKKLDNVKQGISSSYVTVLSDIKLLVCEFESKLNKQSSEISILMDDLECEKQKRVKLEAYPRRMNLRLLYIPEDIQNIRDHVLNIFNRKSQLVLDSDIDQIHRVGKCKHQSVSPRPVLVRFSSVRIRMAVWEKRRMLNDNSGGNRLILTEDFPIEWQERR